MPLAKRAPLLFVIGCFFAQTLLFSVAMDATHGATNVSHIIVCRRGVDVQALVREHGLRMGRLHRHAFNGFWGSLDAKQVEKLKKDSRVSSVEADGQAILHSQTIPTGIRRMGVDHFSVAKIDGLDD